MGDGENALPADAIGALWARALPELLDRVATIEDAVAALLGDALDEPQREAARREAHRLAGALGALGVPAGSVIARGIEDRLATAPVAAAGPDLAERVLALRRKIEDAPAEVERGARVVLAGLDGGRAGALLRSGADRGWRLTAVDEIPDAGDADIVLLDSGLPRLTEAIGRLALGGAEVAVLVGADVDRVALVRAGARRLVPAGLAPDAIVAELDGLGAESRRSLHTILAVDDDPVTLEIVRAALAGAGREVVACPGPAQFWIELERSRPDLVVLDVEMPGADGTELCRALRADPRWRGLPVLFLTATTGPVAVAELFAAGADDYVAKPVRAAELAARVTGRLERTAGAGGGDVDHATGLMRRAVAEPQLERLVALARRLGLPLCVAALGVDGFAALQGRDRDSGLAAAGLAAEAALRDGDLAAAWSDGDGELILGLLGSDADAARGRLVEALDATREQAAGFPSSAGIAEHPRDGADLAGLVAAASAARREAVAGGGGVAIAGAAGGTERVDVVLVEDDELLAQLILDGLRTRGYRTHWIADGDEAASRLGGERPSLRADLVLLDWDLPARDGPTVLRGLAADGALAATRVVMLTARASEREILTTLELGATEHVAKPFSLAVLMQRVERVLGR